MLYRSESLFARPCSTKYCICWTHGGAGSAETETDHLHKVCCSCMRGCKTPNESFLLFQFKSWRCRQDAAGCCRCCCSSQGHPPSPCSLQSSAATIYQDVWIISIKFPSSLRVEKVLNDDNFDILSQLRTEDSPLRCGESAICSLCSPKTNLTTAVYLSTQLWDLAR